MKKINICSMLPGEVTRYFLNLLHKGIKKNDFINSKKEYNSYIFESEKMLDKLSSPQLICTLNSVLFNRLYSPLFFYSLLKKLMTIVEKKKCIYLPSYAYRYVFNPIDAHISSFDYKYMNNTYVYNENHINNNTQPLFSSFSSLFNDSSLFIKRNSVHEKMQFELPLTKKAAFFFDNFSNDVENLLHLDKLDNSFFSSSKLNFSLNDFYSVPSIIIFSQLLRQFSLFNFMKDEKIFSNEKKRIKFYLQNNVSDFLINANLRSTVELFLCFSVWEENDLTLTLCQNIFEKFTHSLESMKGQETFSALFLLLKALSEVGRLNLTRETKDLIVKIKDVIINVLIDEDISSILSLDKYVEENTINYPIQSVLMALSGLEDLAYNNEANSKSESLYVDMHSNLKGFLKNNVNNTNNFVNFLILYSTTLIDQKITSQELWKSLEKIINDVNFFKHPKSQFPMIISRVGRRLPFCKKNFMTETLLFCSNNNAEEKNQETENEKLNEENAEHDEHENFWLNTYKDYCSEVNLFEKYVNLRTKIRDVRINEKRQTKSETHSGRSVANEMNADKKFNENSNEVFESKPDIKEVETYDKLENSLISLMNRKQKLNGKICFVKADYCIVKVNLHHDLKLNQKNIKDENAEIKIKKCEKEESSSVPTHKINANNTEVNNNCFNNKINEINRNNTVSKADSNDEKNDNSLNVLLHINKAVVGGFPGEMTDYFVPGDFCDIIIVDIVKGENFCKVFGQLVLPDINENSEEENWSPSLYIAKDLHKERERIQNLIGKKLKGEIVKLQKKTKNESDFGWVKFHEIKRLGYIHISRILNTTKNEGRALLEEMHQTRRTIEVKVVEVKENQINVQIDYK